MVSWRRSGSPQMKWNRNTIYLSTRMRIDRSVLYIYSIYLFIYQAARCRVVWRRRRWTRSNPSSEFSPHQHSRKQGTKQSMKLFDSLAMHLCCYLSLCSLKTLRIETRRYTYLYTCVIIPRTAVSGMVRNGSLGQLTSRWWSRWVADLCSLMYLVMGLVTNCYLNSKMLTTLLLKLDTLKESLTSFGKAFQFWTTLLLIFFFLIRTLGCLHKC